MTNTIPHGFIENTTTFTVGLMDQTIQYEYPHQNLLLNEHGSLEGVGGLETNEAHHSKTDALLTTEMYFFKIYLRPFLEMLVL